MKKVKKLGASPGGGDSLARYRAANGERQNVFHSLKSIFIVYCSPFTRPRQQKGTKQSQV